MQRDAFWKAGILAALTFTAGLLVGVWLEGQRIEDIKAGLSEADLLFNDVRLQSFYHESFPTDEMFCEAAIAANLIYNERIYNDGKLLEAAEAAGKFSTEELLLQRKRYALQQLQFWLTTLQLKERCNANYTVLLHFWTYNLTDPSRRVEEQLQAAALLQLKEQCGPALMLSNVPVDLGLISVAALVNGNNITRTPAIMIDRTVLLGVQNLEKLGKYVSC
jgi:hypothetical protein